jgi:hypothetical protein
VKPAEIAVARQWLSSDHMVTPTHMNATIEESVFYAVVPGLYSEELSRQQAGAIQNYENANVRDIGKAETRHRKYKRFELGGDQAYDRSSN